MNDLRKDLEALRLGEEAPRRGRWRWLVLAVLVVLVAGGVFAWRSRAALAATEVDTVRPTVQQPAADGSGAPILTASGLCRRAPQGGGVGQDPGPAGGASRRGGQPRPRGRGHRAAGERRLRGAGARAKARVESIRSQHRAAPSARIRRAEADLAEAQRQSRLAEAVGRRRIARPTHVTRHGAASPRARRRSPSGGRRAAVRAEFGRRARTCATQAQLPNTLIRAPFAGVVVKKMAEVGESVAPIPPGVNISTSSGAIVALADLDTLEVEVDVAESNVARLNQISRPRPSVEAFPDRKYRAVLRQVIPDRRSDEGDGHGEGDHSRQGRAAQAGDERAGHVPRARSRSRPTAPPRRGR